MLESRISAGMMVSSARAAATSSQDWERAASVNRAGTPISSIRREGGSSSGDGQPRHVKIVNAGGVAAERACPHDRSGVVISNDLPANGSRFLVIHNGREIDVHIGIPLADPAVHGGKVIRLDNRYAGAT